ncbi:MAG: hypothetical protein LUE17_10825 [Planctomycetaceae bacterium]|nr:hypothetical protein [Planctomycetaceae bacterium]
MADTILLLGHDNVHGLALARVLVSLGFRPLAEDWTEFVPRRRGRDRPLAIIADMDNPAARPLAEFIPRVKRVWGETYPVIATSSSRNFGVTSAFIEDGADDYFSKGAPAGLIEKKVRRCIEKVTSPAISELCDELPTDLLRLFRDDSSLFRLGDVASVHAGVAPRSPWCRRMAPPDDNWRGVITGAGIDKFVPGKPAEFLLWSRLHLFRVPEPGEYSVPEKVVLRRDGPPLRAAVDRSRAPVGADAYAIVPHEGVGAGWLACVLNSRLLDFYFNRLAKNDDGRLRLDVVRRTPVPRPTAESVQELGRTATLLAHFGPSPQSWIDRQSKDELWERMEELVFSLYGADRGAREGLAALHF